MHGKQLLYLGPGLQVLTASDNTTVHLNNNVESLQTRWHHTLLLNGKGNKDHLPQRERKGCFIIHTDVTIPDGGHADRYKHLKEQPADLDDMLCEHIKNFDWPTLRWILQMMNRILKSPKKLWRKSKVTAHHRHMQYTQMCHTQRHHT